MTERGWVSQTEAAKREGVSQPWIAKLIKQGRLEVNEKRQVRMAQVRAVRSTGLDPSRGHHKGGEEVTEGFNAARTRRETAQADMLEMELREKAGQLVDVEQVQAELARQAVLLRETLLAIPSRLGAILAAETDETKALELLDAEIRSALAVFAARLKLRTH